MPSETARLRRRITGHDRRFLLAVGAAVLLGVPSAVLLAGTRSSQAKDAGCVTTTRASIMGAATTRYCGTNAVAVCRQLVQDSGLAAQCDRMAPADKH